VNQVTKELFKKYRKASDYARADLKTLEGEIRSTGFFRNKAKSIIACGQALEEKFNGKVPGSLEELTSLPGVGRKTANIILGNAFGQQAIAVDTHVKRVTHRLGWAKSDDPDKIEFELMEVIPQNRWTLGCHQIVFHGRRVCMAKNPQCPTCPVAKLCPKIDVFA
jgi:endonuclease-3